MNAADVMQEQVGVVRLDEHLDRAAQVMWERDCGFVPVVDDAGELVGTLTDRDLCMACYTQGRPLAELPVTVAMAREVAAVQADAPLAEVLQRMTERQLRRLPVVDARGVLLGVLAQSDLLQLQQQRPKAIPATALLATLASGATPRRGARAFPAAKAKRKPVRKAAKARVTSAASKAAGTRPATKPKAAAKAKPTARAAVRTTAGRPRKARAPQREA